MSKPSLSRRQLSAVLAGTAVGGVVLASCSPQQGEDLTKKFADIITQIQKGVRDACSAAGVLVPTANSVLAVLLAILGTTSPAAVTAQVVVQVIDAIVKQACPATPPPTGARVARSNVRVNNESVSVEFY